MVIDDALGIAGGARGVVERDRVPLVVRHLPGELGVARAEQRFVFQAAQALAGAAEFRVVVIDDERLHFGARQRLLDDLGKLAVGDQHLGIGVIEDEGDEGGVEPGVQRVEHGAGHRHAVMRFDQRRRVGEHHRDGVAALDAAARQRRRQLPSARIELPIIPGARAVNDRGGVGINFGGALQEGQRRQRLEIRRIAVEVNVIGRRHDLSPLLKSSPSVPIPKFASLCGTLVCELRNRRTLAMY